MSASTEDRRRVQEMTHALAHRGPDDAGVERYEGATFGHRRLSIIDLEGGHQPMSNAAGDRHIVFNGEIYNFPELRKQLESEGTTFRTRTDTEVILCLYERHGDSCVERLRGMFAFAIWDERRQRLLLARDRMGQKPLFFRSLRNGGIAFASEVKGILAGEFGSRVLDRQALYHYISLRYIPDDRTLFQDVRKLPAAHVLTWQAGQVRLSRYWTVSYLDKMRGTEEAVSEELDARLHEAVRMHALADVPVGTFLSGGVDSSLMTAMLARQSSERIPTFSIGVGDQDFDELPFARSVASHWNTIPHEEIAAADIVSLLPSMVWHMDEPSDPFGVGVFLVARLASRHVKVVLTGDGGDELFAGYDRYAGNQLVDLYALLPASLRRTVGRAVARRLPNTFGYKSLAQKVTWVNEMSLVDRGARYALSMSFLRFTEDAKAQLFEPDVRGSLLERDSATKILEHFEAPCAVQAVDRMLHTDCMTRLPDHLLLLVDRMSMAHGVEARPPMLDHEVVEFAARIPSSMKLNGRRLKHILRRTAEPYLPPELIDRPKQGFGFPIARWMRDELRPLLLGILSSSRLAESGVFRQQYINELLEAHLAGRADHGFRLWILLNLEIWHRLYIEERSLDDVREWLRRAAHPREQHRSVRDVQRQRRAATATPARGLGATIP